MKNDSIFEINLASTPPRLNVFSPLITEHLREKAKEERERKHWHASDLGYCISGTYYDRLLGKKDRVIDDNQLMNFAIGHLAHEWLEREAEEAEILEASEEDLNILNIKLDASGRPDMLIKVGTKRILYDIKTVNPKAFYWNTKRGYKASEPHIQQLHFYYEDLRKKYGDDIIMAVLYVSKDFGYGFKTQEIIVPYDKNITIKNNDFFNVLNEAWKSKLPPKPEDDVIFNEEKGIYELNWKSKYCNYHEMCTNNANWLKDAEEKIKEMNVI